jgi:NAD(P)-dependent dehydrogenase (short-subunit alcohol dehydrogenase family)
MDPDGYADSVAVNLLAPMPVDGVSRQAQGRHGRRWRHVVTLVSMSAFVSAIAVPAYGSSKAGLVA